MNILQILPELNVGGVETGALDLAKYLVRQNHKAVVVSSGGSLVQEVEALGAVHYTLAVHQKTIFHMLRMVPQLVQIINKEKIDIVHARSRVPAWIAYWACLRTKAIFITTCHGYYKLHPFSIAMGWAKRVIVPSNIIARHMIDDFGVPVERIRLVPRSVDLERFTYRDPAKKRRTEFNVGIIGRITPLKGHLHFIKAMARVSRAVPNLKIWIVGDAPNSRQAYKEQIQVLVRRLGLSHCTEFLGTQRDIPEILSHIDTLVLATVTHEAFGRVVVEAQASGVPVVASAVGGVVDVITDGETGLLVPPADSDRIADAVLAIYRDPARAADMAERAYKKVQEKYNVELMVKNTLDVYRDALSNFKVLTMKFSSLGDVILSSAALRAIREKFTEQYKLSVLVGEESKDVLLRCPYIDELLVADFKAKDKGYKGLWSLGKVLRKKGFDCVIDFQNNRKSHLLGFLSMARERFGYDNRKLGFLLTHRIKEDKAPIDPVAHQFRVLKMLGIDCKDNRLEMWPTDDDRRYVEELLSAEWVSASQKLVGINISASRRWTTKSWPLPKVAQLCEELGYRDIRVVLTGTAEDAPIARTVSSAVKNTKLIDTCGKTTINQLAALIENCAVYVSADSSPLHVAAAMRTPFVALFGPTDPRRHMPPAAKFKLIKKDLACGPCYKPKCRRRKCMELISVSEVLDAVVSFLS